eukprot:2865994-Rhodomonas_salina.1
MEEEGARASEGSKKGEGEGRKKTSLACQYCFRTMAPSKHDRCTFCSVCHEQMVETRCLKEDFGACAAVARSKGALDAKGEPDIDAEKAGMSAGRVCAFLAGTGEEARFGGKCGYDIDSAGKKIFKFVCAACTDVAKTPARILPIPVDPLDVEDGVDAERDSVDRASRSAGPITLGLVRRVTHLAIDARDSSDVGACDLLSDWLRNAPEGIRKAAGSTLGWTQM